MTKKKTLDKWKPECLYESLKNSQSQGGKMIRVLKELIDKCNGSGWEHWLNMEHKHALTLLHALKAVEMPEKRALSSDPEDTEWDIRAVEWNDALAACQPFLLKQQVKIADLQQKLSKEDIRKWPETVKYSVSDDGVGLLGYFKDGGYYHIHSDEMSELEKWIHGILRPECRREVGEGA